MGIPFKKRYSSITLTRTSAEPVLSNNEVVSHTIAHLMDVPDSAEHVALLAPQDFPSPLQGMWNHVNRCCGGLTDYKFFEDIDRDSFFKSTISDAIYIDLKRRKVARQCDAAVFLSAGGRVLALAAVGDCIADVFARVDEPVYGLLFLQYTHSFVSTLQVKSAVLNINEDGSEILL